MNQNSGTEDFYEEKLAMRFCDCYGYKGKQRAIAFNAFITGFYKGINEIIDKGEKIVDKVTRLA